MGLMTTKNEAEFKALVAEIEKTKGYKRAIGFGIARVDRGQKNQEKILQATFPVLNWNENFGSAAIFVAALKASGAEVDFSQSEQIFDVKKKFLKYATNAFTPYLLGAYGEKHKSVQVIQILDWLSKGGKLGGTYRIVLIFEDAKPKSVEALYFKLNAIKLEKAPSLNLEGANELLCEAAWSFGQPIEYEWLKENEIEMKLLGEYPPIQSIGKLPQELKALIG